MTKKTWLTNFLNTLVLLLVMPVCWAQDSNEESPPSENNIICFAAKKQWVCAPADEQHKAQEKAKKLALESDQPELIDDGVEIQTLQPVNIGLQARESNTRNIPYAIQDFIPREESIQQQQAPEQQTPEMQTKTDKSEQLVENTIPTQVEPVNTENRPVSASSEPPMDESISAKQSPEEVQKFNSAPNDFSYWQAHFAKQWTFQVVGTSNRHHLDDFVIRHGLTNRNYTIVRTQRDGADWWIVLVGLYSSRDEAKSEQHALPLALANGAWLRQIQSIDGFDD